MENPNVSGADKEVEQGDNDETEPEEVEVKKPDRTESSGGGWLIYG
jgi:hypothetical protein